MNVELPLLIAEDLLHTRNYIQNITKVLGALQLAYLPYREHDWQYGLEINMRGICTQELTIEGKSIRATLDFVRHKVRIGDTNWPLEEYSAPEILNNIKVWLEAHGQSVTVTQPVLEKAAKYDLRQATLYAESLWWLNRQFMGVKASIAHGKTSPILLFPDQCTMALTWFPKSGQQCSIGYSAGDKTLREPYVYVTAKPEPTDFKSLALPSEAHWQELGFSGAVLPYALLQTARHPQALFKSFATDTMQQAWPIL